MKIKIDTFDSRIWTLLAAQLFIFWSSIRVFESGLSLEAENS